jgi:hypothetical protein
VELLTRHGLVNVEGVAVEAVMSLDVGVGVAAAAAAAAASAGSQ